jgi:pSer/pThr/pTyr-binding forkhead associated (FHA) protein
MKLQLVVMTPGKTEGKAIPITLSQFLIGRDPQCHLRPASAVISKRHCALLTRGEEVFLRDFDSTNGTFVNDQPVKGEVQLHDNDQLKVGPLLFRVKLEATVAVNEPTPVPPTKVPAAAAMSPAAAGKTPLPPTKTAKTPLPPTKAPEPAAAAAQAEAVKDTGSDSDDDVAAMLLSLGDDGAGAPSDATAMTDIPEGSTVMDLPSPFDAKKEEKDKEKEKKKALGNTSSAAKEILEKYMRRPRT